jgi:NADH-quinone oxidoreductase subunit K
MMCKFLIADISLEYYLTLSAALFMIGIYGLLANRTSMIAMLMAIELMLLAVNINFVAFSVYWQDISGQLFTIFVLTVAAAEAAIGLAIMMSFFRNKGDIAISRTNELKG